MYDSAIRPFHQISLEWNGILQILLKLLKVATDWHSRLVRNKSALASLLIIKACLDPPWQVLRSTKTIVPTAVSWHCCEPALADLSPPVKALSKQLQGNKECQGLIRKMRLAQLSSLLRAALEVCYESIWGPKVEAVLDLLRTSLECRSVATLKILQCSFKAGNLVKIVMFGYNEFFFITSGKYSSGSCPSYPLGNVQVSCVMKKHLSIMNVM